MGTGASKEMPDKAVDVQNTAQDAEDDEPDEW